MNRFLKSINPISHQRKMKKSLPILLIIFLIFTFSCTDESTPTPETPSTSTALIITGASARLSHLIALTERLDNQGYLNNLEFISGVSSGAANAVMLNAIKDDNGFGWDEAKNATLSLSNSDVYTTTGALPIGTSPLENLFTLYVENALGYSALSDLPYNTAISSIEIESDLGIADLIDLDLDKVQLKYSSNIVELDNIGGNIVESLMATTALPVVSYSYEIDGASYVDASLVETIPFSALTAYESLSEVAFDSIFIVSFQKNEATNWDAELDTLGLTGILKDTYLRDLEASGLDLDVFSEVRFNEELTLIQSFYPDFASKCYVYVPDIEDADYYGITDFSSETAQNSYESVRNWALENEPMLLADYLAND